MTQWSDKWGGKWGCDDVDADQITMLPICIQYLWWQHRDHPQIQKLCLVAAIVFSRLDVKLQQVITNRGIDGASGGELDNWGELVDELRNGASDLLYRRVIKAKARASLGSGNISDFFDVATLVSPSSDPRFAEIFPACVRMFFSDAISTEERQVIFDLMRQVPALGVCLSFVEVDDDGVFEFSYTNDDMSKDPVEFHWSHTDGDVVNTAGFAFLVEF